MGKELLLVAEALSNEKGVSKAVVLESIQIALESATRKLFGAELGIRVHLDSRTGEYETFRYWDVVADDALEFPDRELTLLQARERSADTVVGDRIEESMPSIEFGRIAAQTARQVMIKEIRAAEIRQLVEQFKSRLGQLIYLCTGNPAHSSDLKMKLTQPVVSLLNIGCRN